MAIERERTQGSRRWFVRGAAGTTAGIATAPALATAASGEAAGKASLPPDAEVAVAATVVRVSHMPVGDGLLAVGVRTSIRAPDVSADGYVLVVEGVDYWQEPAVLKRQLVEGVRRQVADRLAASGRPIDPARIAVQVFGGAL